MWRGPQWRAQPAAALEKKTRRTRSIAHLAGFARLGEDRESGGPQFFFVFLGGTKKKEKILNPLYPFSQKNSVPSVQALQYPVYHPLSSASYIPPFTSPFDRGVHAPPPHQPHPHALQSLPPPKKKEALCTTPPHDSHVSCQISARRCHQEATAVSCNTCPVVCAIAQVPIPRDSRGSQPQP